MDCIPGDSLQGPGPIPSMLSSPIATDSPDQFSLSNKHLVALLCLYALYWLPSVSCLTLQREMEREKAGWKIIPSFWFWSVCFDFCCH